MTKGTTTDRTDPRLGHGADDVAKPQNEVYLVLSLEERQKGFVRPLRSTYTHTVCGTDTSMGLEISETYARQPSFYGSIYCVYCSKHRPVAEFVWKGTNLLVGS